MKTSGWGINKQCEFIENVLTLYPELIQKDMKSVHSALCECARFPGRWRAWVGALYGSSDPTELTRIEHGVAEAELRLWIIKRAASMRCLDLKPALSEVQLAAADAAATLRRDVADGAWRKAALKKMAPPRHLDAFGEAQELDTANSDGF